MMGGVGYRGNYIVASVGKQREFNVEGKINLCELHRLPQWFTNFKGKAPKVSKLANMRYESICNAALQTQELNPVTFGLRQTKGLQSRVIANTPIFQKPPQGLTMRLVTNKRKEVKEWEA